MPHLVLAGDLDLEAVAQHVEPVVRRWNSSVLKTEFAWLRQDCQALLFQGIVVEFSRPLHPVALVAPHHGDTIVRLWSLAPVERTQAVQRWLVLLAEDLRQWGAGRIVSTNIPQELLAES